MIPLKQMNEIYNNWIQIGVFSQFTQAQVPWDVSINSQLDMMYFSHSGYKTGNSIFTTLVDDDYHITQQSATTIATLLATRYGLKWKELYKTLSYEYEPLQNYSLTEVTEEQSTGNENTSEDGSKTRNVSATNTGTDTTVVNGTKQIDSTTTNTGTNTVRNTGNVTVSEDSTTTSSNSNITSGTDNDESKLYGFNSSSAVNDSENNRTRSGTENGNSESELDGNRETTQDTTSTETRNLTDTLESTNTDNTTSTETKNLANSSVESDITSNTMTSAQSGTKDITMTRQGMNGSTTFQRMIQHQRNVWAYDFFETVFNDIDYLLTIPIY